MSYNGGNAANLATGLFDGINNAVAIMRDDKSRREKEQRENTLYEQQQTQYAQGQEERGYALERRGIADEQAQTKYAQGQTDRANKLERTAITEERSDAEYERGEKKRVRMQKSQQALNGFMVGNDLNGVNAFLGEYGPDGVKVNVIEKDGKYYMERVDPNTGKVDSKEFEKRDIGMVIMRMGNSDVLSEYQKQFDAEKASETKKDDQDFELKKIREKGYQMRKNKTALKRNLTKAQVANNKEIDAARKAISKLTREEILAKTQQYTNTGRENPDFDPYLSGLVKKATNRKVGSDPDFKKVFNQYMGDEETSNEPPVEGARQAKDGNWYVKQNDQWFKVGG